ncbi:MAG TPA: LysR family transcriptional regulator [Candidatus Limnocylindria bacterium]|nr:LysR family transcriptional regulator [Candidatus Limnocylindria bacterium]
METIDWLVLQEIHRHKSLSKAGESLFLSQPAITYRVNRMETEFGRALFTRGRQGTQLTEAGMQLLSFSSRMIQYEREVRQAMAQDAGGRLNDIELGTTGNFFNLFHVHQVKAFRDAHPDVRVNIRIEPSGSLYRQIKEGKLLMGVIREVQLNQWDEDQFLVFDDPLNIASSVPITEEMLVGTPMIRNLTNPYLANIVSEWIMNSFDRIPVSDYINVTGDSRNVVAMIKAGLGWAILTESRLESADGLYLEPIRKPDGTPYRLNTYFIYRKEALEYGAYAAYVNHFREYFAQGPKRHPGKAEKA